MADLEKRLRNLGKEGYKFDSMTTKPPSTPSTEKEEQEAMELDIDISGIDWKLSKKAGGGPAGPQDGWAWAFGYTKDGGIRRETMQLIQALEQYGTVRVGNYKISLGGRDGTLLNRRKV